MRKSMLNFKEFGGRLGTSAVSALQSATGRATQLVLAGNFGAAVLGFLLNLLLLRMFSMEDYGVFSLFSSALMLAAGVMALGWTDTYSRFGGKFRDSAELPAIRRHALARVARSAFGLGLLYLLAAPWLSQHLYHRPEITPLLRWAAAGAVCTCLFSFAQTDLSVRRKFKTFVLFQLASPTLRLLALLGLALASALAVETAVWTTTLVACALALTWAFTSLRAAPSIGLAPELPREMSGYQRWIVASLITTHLIGNIDTHFLAYFHDDRTLSAFGASSKLTLPIFMLVSALTTTMLPRLSGAKNHAEIRHYLRHLLIFLIPLALLILIACGVAPPLLVWLAGAKYSGIESLIRLQLLSALVVLVTNPVSLILYAWGRTRQLAFLNFGQLVGDVLLNLLWIPRFGAAGAVASTVAVNLIGLSFVSFQITRELRGGKST